MSATAFTAPAGKGTIDAAALAVADLDADGDEDALLATPSALRRLQNEGGNRHRSFAVQLDGRVSNKGGVGAKVEIRAGNLRQKIETSSAVPMAAPADVVFGLGPRKAPDAVRVIWVSGIVQTETEMGASGEPGRRAALAVNELDRKPSSCPYLYAWNGQRFEFLTDFLGAGEIGYYVAPGVRSDPDPVEYVRIAPGRLAPRDGRYELRVTNELEEVLYLDRLRLLALDHPADVEVHPDEGMTDPPKPFRLFATRDPRTPRATDHRGRDVTARLARTDRSFVDDLPLERIRGYAKEHALTFDLSSLPPSHTVLLLTGWTDYAFSSDNVAAHQAGLASKPPRLEVEGADGTWTTAVEQVGIPVGRPQTIVVDLAGRLGPSRRARVVTSMRVYWDQAAVAAPAPDVALAPVALDPLRADLGERGFSAVATHGRAAGLRLRAGLVAVALEDDAGALHPGRRRAAAARRDRRHLRGVEARGRAEGELRRLDPAAGRSGAGPDLPARQPRLQQGDGHQLREPRHRPAPAVRGHEGLPLRGDRRASGRPPGRTAGRGLEHAAGRPADRPDRALCRRACHPEGVPSPCHPEGAVGTSPEGSAGGVGGSLVARPGRSSSE